jgi:hypothetical protein
MVHQHYDASAIWLIYRTFSFASAKHLLHRLVGFTFFLSISDMLMLLACSAFAFLRFAHLQKLQDVAASHRAGGLFCPRAAGGKACKADYSRRSGPSGSAAGNCHRAAAADATAHKAPAAAVYRQPRSLVLLKGPCLQAADTTVLGFSLGHRHVD